MPSAKKAAEIQAELNRMEPAARDAALGNLLVALISGFNALQADVVALNAAQTVPGTLTSAQLGPLGTY